MTEVKIVQVRQMLDRERRAMKKDLEAYRSNMAGQPVREVAGQQPVAGEPFKDVAGWQSAERQPTREVGGQQPAEKKPVVIAPAPKQKRKRKVAAYCRVSTLLHSQETSIESQREHYEQEIRSNEEWEFAGIYLERGVSGTKAETRPELQRLISDCSAGKIDLILTKSISRFARNTSDCLQMVRTLTAFGVDIRFAKEEIDTGTMETEFLLSILACLAEAESHSLSGNMKWSIRRRFENGTFRQAIAPYGYEWKEGVLTVVPQEAEVVRRIYSMVLSGSGMNTIAKRLNEEAIPGPTGKRWMLTTLRAIVKNPAYMGDALYQKTYRDENFRQRKNKGELDQYYDAGHHEAIISKEDFHNAQAAISQRAKAVGYSGGEENRGGNRYCFSGILICKECGAVMHRQLHKNGRVSWICHKHKMHPDLCRMKPQSDEDIRAAFVHCLNTLSRLPESKTADSVSAFPEEAFREFVEFCTVDSRKEVTFHFRCGLTLTERLYRKQAEG